MQPTGPKEISHFFTGKSGLTIGLFNHFISAFEALGPISLHATKTMIAVSGSGDRRIAWVTQLGKNFIHVVFPFKQAYEDNLCFQKVAQVPGDAKQFNHHFRMLHNEDVNAEVKKFMKLALSGK